VRPPPRGESGQFTNPPIGGLVQTPAAPPHSAGNKGYQWAHGARRR
jgi:hypothetical protein